MCDQIYHILWEFQHSKFSARLPVTVDCEMYWLIAGSEREILQPPSYLPPRRGGGVGGPRRGSSGGDRRGGRGTVGRGGRGGSVGGVGGGRGGRKENTTPPSKEKLDEEMDAYMSSKAA